MGLGSVARARGAADAGNPESLSRVAVGEFAGADDDAVDGLLKELERDNKIMYSGDKIYII